MLTHLSLQHSAISLHASPEGLHAGVACERGEAAYIPSANEAQATAATRIFFIFG